MTRWAALKRSMLPAIRLLRTKRLKRFWDGYGLTESTRVLDVGGTAFMWQLLPRRPSLVMLNIVPPKDWTMLPSVPWVIGDGRRLPFGDKTFDVVFSNSVIEHLGTLEDQQSFADECRRVGVRYYVQTPYRWFPIEPHLLSPLIHWLPKGFQMRMLRNFTIWGWLKRPTAKQCSRFVREVRLLTRVEMHKLFPDGEIQQERVIGLTKSLIAIR